MANRIEWTWQARVDYIQAVEFLAEYNATFAEALERKIEQKTQQLVSFPRRGRTISELKDISDEYREIIIDQYRVMYLILEEVIIIMAVLDARRDVASILEERMKNNP